MVLDACAPDEPFPHGHPHPPPMLRVLLSYYSKSSLSVSTSAAANNKGQVAFSCRYRYDKRSSHFATISSICRTASRISGRRSGFSSVQATPSHKHLSMLSCDFPDSNISGSYTSGSLCSDIADSTICTTSVPPFP